MNKILVIGDNPEIMDKIKKIPKPKGYKFVYTTSRDINVKKEAKKLVSDYDMIISAHCHQIFPKNLVLCKRCINIHPGYLPYNRGMYPNAWSIINGLPCGATIHEMDEKIDRGFIIARKKIEIKPWWTGEDLHNKITKEEINLFRKNLKKILSGKYKKIAVSKGNLNTLRCFENLKKLNMDECIVVRDFINRLRALSHSKHNNAYFIDNGKKIYVKLSLEK